MATKNAQSFLILAGKSGMATYANCLAWARAAVAEGTATTKFKTPEAGKLELAKMMASAKTGLVKIIGAFSTIEKYLRMSASVALVPDVEGTIESGAGEKKSVRTVGIDDIKTRRDLSACATAAGPMLGARVKSAGTGRSVIVKPAEAAAVRAATDKIRAVQAEAESVKVAASSNLQLFTVIADAFTAGHAAQKATIIDALASVGFQLALLAKAKTVRPTAADKAATLAGRLAANRAANHAEARA